MKIIQFIPTLGMGGAESLVKDYALNLCENNQIIIVVMRKILDSKNKKILKDNKIKVLVFEDNGDFKNNSKIKAIMRRSKWFGDVIQSENPDVIHSHLPINIYLYLNKKALKGVKLFHTIHNEPKFYFGKRLIDKLDKMSTKYLVKKHDMRLITLHDEMNMEINDIFNCNNSVVVNNGVELSRFKKESYNKSNIRQSLGFLENDFVVGHVGRFTEQKNHKFLIETFYEMTKIKDNAKLILVGAGELKTEVLKQIKDYKISDKVVMLENRKDIPELMSVMDVFVFPSIYEGLPVTLVEAQAIGVKCVVSNNVTRSVHLKDDYLSLCLGESAQSWCEKILDKGIKTKPNGNIKEFDIKEVMKKLESLYKVD